MNAQKKMTEIVGLIPAAGTADRISPLPCSKEIFPVGYQRLDGLNGPRPKVAAHYLLEKMKAAGARKSYIVLRKGKWDIPAYFGSGRSVDSSLAYLVMDLPYGAPFTLDQAFDFIHADTILFGFPDILFRPFNAYSVLLERLSESAADIALGLFPAHNPQKMDMVVLDDTGKIRGLDIKPETTRLKYTWIIAAWTPEFTGFMHRHLKERQEAVASTIEAGGRELYVGDVIQAALEGGLHVEHVVFGDGRYLDIGTPEDLIQADAFASHDP